MQTYMVWFSYMSNHSILHILCINLTTCPEKAEIQVIFTLGHWLAIHLKKVLMGEKKKTINVLTAFFISHKSGVKTFLKWIVNQYPTTLVNMTLYLLYY